MQRFGELMISENGKTQVYPTYCCGHCSDVVIMRPDRSRERRHCFSCGKMICEQKKLCNMECTPIHALARDHFEHAEKYRLLDAITHGATSEKEALEKGIIIQGA